MTQTPTQIVFQQTMTGAMRWIIGAAGLFCFFPTYDPLVRPGVPVLQLGMLPMWIIALGAMSIGVLLLAAAILGISRTLIFDAAAGEMRELGAGAFGLRWGRRQNLRDLGAPEVSRETDSEGPTRYAVMIPCSGRKQRLRVESYDDEAAAAATAQRIAALLLKRASASP